MKRNHIAALFFLVSLLATSCSKVDSLLNNGKPVTELRSVSQRFGVIQMYNNVNVKLVHDWHPRLELTCPENLIGNITTEVKGDTLVIMNENRYNWLRSFDYSIDLTVYYDSLRAIEYGATGTLLSTDTLKGCIVTDTLDDFGRSAFLLRITEGCGDIDLTFNCDVLRDHFSFGTSLVTLRGIAGYSEHILRSFGTVHAENLNSNFVRVVSESTNDTYVWVRDWGGLRAKLTSIGNLYYKGNPSPRFCSEECTSEGRVIKLE